jgi:hypothetical protein
LRKVAFLGRFGADGQRQDTVPLLEAAASNRYPRRPRWRWGLPERSSGNAGLRFSIRVDRNGGRSRTDISGSHDEPRVPRECKRLQELFWCRPNQFKDFDYIIIVRFSGNSSRS